MLRNTITIIVLVLSLFNVEGQTQNAIVVDSATRRPLPTASIFDRHGHSIGTGNNKGILPYISADRYPITIRYLGFKEKVVPTASSDTIFLQGNMSELPEVVVEAGQRKVLHILTYVREYSTLATYPDTIFLFREKKVDFMLSPDDNMKYRGWTIPRVLTCKSYYRFTNDIGLDSVSDESNYHFSWSDWIGIAPTTELPSALRNANFVTDSVSGRFAPKEIWTRHNDKVTVDVDVLADTTGRRWVPHLSGFFKEDLDFEYFKVRFNYDNIDSDSVSPLDLTGFSFNIQSNGRGHAMYRLKRNDEPLFVSTYAEVYVLDKKFITVKEAKRLEHHKFNPDLNSIFTPLELPELNADILALVDRVNNIDKNSIRLDLIPDSRMISKFYGHKNHNIGQRALFLLKEVTGISYYKSHKNFNQNWEKTKKKAWEETQRRAKQEIERQKERQTKQETDSCAQSSYNQNLVD